MIDAPRGERVSPARQGVALDSSARNAFAISGDLFVLELFRRHCLERSSVTHAALR